MEFVRFLLFAILISKIQTDNIYTINGKRPLHSVSNKFLSLSVDPLVLLSGIKWTDTSLLLASHLSPAYIRISGPTTERITISNDPGSPSELIVTSFMWESLNDWLAVANLTPVFAINDAERVNGVWDPKLTYPLFDWSKKLKLSGCFWQMGYDCSNKDLDTYKEDVNRLRVIVDDFADNDWKIVGSDLSKCLPGNESALARTVISDLENGLDALMWELPSDLKEDAFPKMFSKTGTEIWTSVPESARSGSFESGLVWAEKVGDAAKFGYSVLFRTPGLKELQSETPIYWISLLHKLLMGRKVLDVKGVSNDDDIKVFAHCAQNQNKYTKRGAVTIFAINPGENLNTVAVKIGGVHFKNAEVQSYTLNSPDDTSVFLNGEQLSVDLLEQIKLNFAPKLRRAKNDKILYLEVPPKSVSFFVLPGARLPACVVEDDMQLIMEEIEQNQNISFETVTTETLPETLNTRSTSKERPARDLQFDGSHYRTFHKPKTSSKRNATPKNHKKRNAMSRLLDILKTRTSRGINMELLNQKFGDHKKVDYSDESEEEPRFAITRAQFEDRKRGNQEKAFTTVRRKPKFARKTLSDMMEEEEERALASARKFLAKSDERHRPKVHFAKKSPRELNSPDSFLESYEELEQLDYGDANYVMDDYYYNDMDSRDSLFRRKRSNYVPKESELSEEETSNLLGTKNYYYVVGKPYDPKSIKINNNAKEKQFKMLRTKLAQYKRNQEKKRFTEEHQGRQKRSLTTINNRRNFPYGDYVQKSAIVHEWQPVDILEFNKRDSCKFRFNKLYRNARSLDKTENDVDDALNEISKDLRLDLDSGEYKLTLSNGDQFELVGRKDETDIRFIRSHKSAPLVITTEESSSETTPGVDEDIKATSVGGLRDEGHVQKIPRRNEVDWFEKLYESFALVVEKIHKELLKLLE